MGDEARAMSGGGHVFVDSKIVLHHALDGESFLKDCPAPAAVDQR